MDKLVVTGLAALTLLDISASTAQAQDWTGGYIGAHGGYRWSDAKLSTDAYSLPIVLNGWDTATTARSESYDLNSGIGGLHGGYNFQIGGPWVLGLEGDASWGAGKDSKSRTLDCEDGPTCKLVSEADFNWQATLRGRIGYSSGPMLFYGTAGVAWADIDWRENYSLIRDPSILSTTVTKSKLLTGWVIGAGAEYAMTSNWILRGEYLYEDFGSFSVPLASSTNSSGNVDVKAQKLRIGISYKF
jgi:outer membrane immunogenic protein